MDIATARTVLGVTAGDEWSAVRGAFRRRIRATHPDVVGERGTDASIQLTDAYRTLAAAHREGRLHIATPTPVGPPPTQSPSSPPPTIPDERLVADDVRIRGGDTLVFSSTPEETFRRMVEAAHALGEISYIDRNSSIFEAVLHLEEGAHASFVVSLQWRAHDATCEAFCTLEALDRAESLDVGGVLAQLVPFIPPDRDARPL